MERQWWRGEKWNTERERKREKNLRKREHLTLRTGLWVLHSWEVVVVARESRVISSFHNSPRVLTSLCLCVRWGKRGEGCGRGWELGGWGGGAPLCAPQWPPLDFDIVHRTWFPTKPWPSQAKFTQRTLCYVQVYSVISSNRPEYFIEWHLTDIKAKWFLSCQHI